MDNLALTLKHFDDDLDNDYRNTLNDNFKLIQDSLNDIDSRLGKLENSDSDTSNVVTRDDIKNLESRINRIIIGIDEPTIDEILDKKLTERGL